MPKPWLLPYPRPRCPKCRGDYLTIGAPPRHPDPALGSLVRFICPSCKSSMVATATAPLRFVTLDHRRPRVPRPVGAEDLPCRRCGHRLSYDRSESKPEQGLHRFFCTTVTCSRRRKVRWFEERHGRLLELAPAEIQRRGHLAVARTKLAPLSFSRPVCHCGRPKALTTSRPHKVLGRLFHFACREHGAEELRDAQGRLVTEEERKRVRGESQWRVRDLPVVRPLCPVSTCGRAMVYAGRRRSTGLFRFFCQSDHDRIVRYLTEAGQEVAGDRTYKVLPFPRPLCECGRRLVSQGEYRDNAGRLLFRLFCKAPRCDAKQRYFDERGQIVHQSRGLFRSRSRPFVKPDRRDTRVCQGCGEKPVRYLGDARSVYCEDCARRSTWAWRQLTPEWIRKRREKLALTQADLARAAGLSLPLYKKVEQDRAVITKKTKQALARAFARAERGTEPATTQSPTLRLVGGAG